jgi:phosphate transport system substrate-binding protein
VQAFVDFMHTDPAKEALRKHAVLPFEDGSALTALDSSRRDKILAAVGARRRTPVAAPGATYAAGAAIAPTSPKTLAARTAMEERKAPTPPPVAPAPSKLYTVSKGDTLSVIAKKHDVTVAQLRDWNHLKNDNLKIGQVLHLDSK